MKLFLCNFFLFFSLAGFSQLNENFSDGNFSANPTWNGSTSRFKVNTSAQLQLNDTATSNAYLYTDLNLNSLDSIEWSFYLKLSFAASANNNARFYLTSDQADLTGPLNGYFLQFGETGSNDAIELFKQNGTTTTSIARGNNTFIASSFAVYVKVLRRSNGEWKIYAGNTTQVTWQATGNDNSINNSLFTGIVCNYTVSNTTKFYVDDLYVVPIIKDVTAPSIKQIMVIDSKHLDVEFSESLDSIDATTASYYSVNNATGVPSAAVPDNSNKALIHLTFVNDFANGKESILTIDQIKDIENNIAYNLTEPFLFYEAEELDVIINEILYDPKTGGTDFIEIYNRSEKIVNLKNISICSYDTITQLISSSYVMSDTALLFYPAQYMLLSENTQAVLSQYQTENKNAFHQLSNIPSMNISGGGIALMANDTIDKLKYDPSMHYALLTETKGVSLERINYHQPTQQKSIWHSAAESVGYATPGYLNSQYLSDEQHKNIAVVPELFSPDNDGYNDVTAITYTIDKVGYSANVSIYNSSGVLIKQLVKNEPLASSGSFLWHGLTDNNEKAPIGIYVVFIELYNTEGDLKQYKRICTVAGKL